MIDDASLPGPGQYPAPGEFGFLDLHVPGLKVKHKIPLAMSMRP